MGSHESQWILARWIATCQIPFSQMVPAPAHFSVPLEGLMVEPTGEVQPVLSGCGKNAATHLATWHRHFRHWEGEGQELRRAHMPQCNGDMCVKGPRAA